MPSMFPTEGQPQLREEPMTETRPFCISKHAVWDAWLHVKANQGAAGADDESIDQFEKRLKMNLYKIWNRMSSRRHRR